MPDQNCKSCEDENKKQELEVLKAFIQARHYCLMAADLGVTNIKVPTIEDFKVNPHSHLVPKKPSENTRNRVGNYNPEIAAHMADVALDFIYTFRDMLGPVFDERAHVMAHHRGSLYRDPKTPGQCSNSKRKKRKNKSKDNPLDQVAASDVKKTQKSSSETKDTDQSVAKDD